MDIVNPLLQLSKTMSATTMAEQAKPLALKYAALMSWGGIRAIFGKKMLVGTGLLATAAAAGGLYWYYLRNQAKVEQDVTALKASLEQQLTSYSDQA